MTCPKCFQQISPATQEAYQEHLGECEATIAAVTQGEDEAEAVVDEGDA